jgi:hypothetical protein
MGKKFHLFYRYIIYLKNFGIMQFWLRVPKFESWGFRVQKPMGQIQIFVARFETCPLDSMWHGLKNKTFGYLFFVAILIFLKILVST